MDNKFIFSLIFAFIFSFAFTVAQGLGPGVPHQFYGTATYNGVAADDIVVEVYIEGIKVGSTTTSNGIYGYDPIFLVKDPDGKYEGKTINFYLNGVDTGVTSIFENGASTKLDLSATGSLPSSPPSGGGGSSGGGGGGSGGSGASSTTTIKKGGDGVQEATVTIQTDEEAGDGKETTGQEEMTGQETSGFFSKITGAIVGAGGVKAVFAVGFIVAVVVVAIIVAVVKKRKERKGE